jgi:hypothetical protein
MMVVPLMFVDGGSFMKGFKSEEPTEMEKLAEKVPKGVKAVVTDEEVEVYKWRNEHGILQFSEVSPANVDEVEKIVLSPDVNIIDAIKIPEKESEKKQKPNIISLRSPYSVDGMKGMINDSMQVQQDLNEKQAEQEKMLEEIINQK